MRLSKKTRFLMTGISQVSSKSLPAADEIQQGDSLASQGITDSDTHKLPEAKSVSVSSFAVSWAKNITVQWRHEKTKPRDKFPKAQS